MFESRNIVSNVVAAVGIHLELIPSGELMSSEQNKRASSLPVVDPLQFVVVQRCAEELSVMFNRTG